MTFLEFMEKLNELYVGNERDLCYKDSGGLRNDR
jgi:hypothetical protein